MLEGASPRAKSPSFGDIAFFRFLVKRRLFNAGFAKDVTSVISNRFFPQQVSAESSPEKKVRKTVFSSYLFA